MRCLKLQTATVACVLALIGTACGGGGGGVSLPTPSPSPTPTLTPTPTPTPTGTVTGTAVVDAGTVSAAFSRVTVDTRPPRDIRSLPTLVPDRIVVKLRPSADINAFETVVRAARGQIVNSIPRLNTVVVRLEANVLASSAIATLRASPLVQHAEQDGYAYAMATPNDPLYPSQWHYPMIQLPTAWDVTTGSPVIVAVVDTGIRPDHPEFGGGVLVAGRNFFNGADDANTTDPGCPTVDPAQYSHGTHVGLTPVSWRP